MGEISLLGSQMFKVSEIVNKSHVLAAMWVAISATFLLAGYECVRSASFTLFKAYYGVQNLPIIIAITPIGVFSSLWVYGRCLKYVGPRRTLSYSTLASAFFILMSYALVLAEMKVGSALLFIVRDCYAVLIIEQYWSFINSILNKEEAKTYNGLILAIATLGGISGGFFVHSFAESIGTKHLIFIGALFCFPSWILSQRAYKLSGYSADKEKSDTAHKPEHLAIHLFFRNKILFLIMGMVLLGQFYSYFIGLSFQEVVHEYYPDLDAQTSFMGFFFGLANVSSILAQFFLTPFVLKNLSIPFIHIMIPLINGAFLFFVFLKPGIYSISAAYLAIKIIEYSIFRASKEILYIPLSFDVRYRAKEWIDVFVHRSAQGFISTVFGLLQKISFLGRNHIPILSASILLLWFLTAFPLSEMRKKEG